MDMCSTGRIRRVLGFAAASAVFMLAKPASAQKVAYVLNTDGATVPVDVQNAIRARLGSTATIIPIGPSTVGASINGTPVRFLADQTIRRSDPGASSQNLLIPNAPDPVASRFFVAGDLTLGANDSIWGTGSKLIQLEVGNNANLATGSFVTVSAIGTRGGAGGGNGGNSSVHGSFGRYNDVSAANNPPIDGVSAITPGGLGAPNLSLGSPARGANGSPGVTPIIRALGSGTNLTPSQYAGSVAGFAGTAGQGDQFYATDPITLAWTKQTNSIGGAAFSGPSAATPGTGGIGGSSSGTSSPFGGGGVNGGNGGPGGDGGNGANGTPGSNGAVISLGAGVAHLRGGSGGGGGGAGGNGVWGGNGGGGGGGGSAEVVLAAAGGGNGGWGAPGGFGGDGGNGGAGGGGGGGIQLLVQGRVLNSASIEAAGANGQLGAGGFGGAAGDNPMPASQLLYGPTNGTNTILGVKGGDGGLGGKGGTGGAGGSGGIGAGGAGGSVQIVTSFYVQQAGATFDTSGGGTSAAGAALFNYYGGTNITSTVRQIADFEATGSNPYTSYRTVIGTPVIRQGYTPNISIVEGGAAPYGRIADVINPNAFNTQFATVNRGSRPSNEIAGVARFAASTVVGPYADYDVLAFMSWGTAISNPRISIIGAGDFLNLTQPIALRKAGWKNDPTYTPGATGPANIGTLDTNQTWLTMIPRGTTHTVTVDVDLYGGTRRFIGSPTYTVSTNSPLVVEDRGLLQLRAKKSGSTTPEASYTASDMNGGTAEAVIVARVGAPLVLDLSAVNIGTAGTTTPGTFSVNGGLSNSFSQGAGVTSSIPGASLTFNTINVRTPGRGQQLFDAGNVRYIPHYDDRTDPQYTLNIKADLVGPRFGLFHPTTLDELSTLTAPTTAYGSSSMFSFLYANSADGIFDDGGYRNDLINNLSITGLTLFNVRFEGPDAASFALLKPFVGQMNGLTPLFDNGLVFTPNRIGTLNAELVFETDMNAAFGLQGDTLRFPVSAVAAVPEPATLFLLVMAGGLTLLRRKRRLAASQRL